MRRPDTSLRLRSITLLVALLCSNAATAQVGLWQYVQQLDGNEGNTPAQGLPTLYGTSIAADQGWLAVGMPFHDALSGAFEQVDAGAVMLYRRSNGTYPVSGTLILSGSLQAGARFGTAVDIQGDTLMIGAPGYGPNTEGRVEFWRYVPATQSWTFESAHDGGVSPTERLGNSVSLSGNRAASGASGHRPSAALAASGRVQVFSRASASTAFTATQSILPPNAVASGAFGSAIAIHDAAPGALIPDRLAIGEPGGGGGTVPLGLVWVYEFNGTTPAFARLIATPPNFDGIGLGSSVQTSGSHVVSGGLVASMVLIERRTSSGWETLPPLPTPAGSGPDTNFGRGLHLSRSHLLVGRVDEVDDTGRAYLFETNASGGFDYRLPFLQPDTSAGVWGTFGEAVALDGLNAVIASPEDTVNSVAGAGRVAVYGDYLLLADGFESALLRAPATAEQ